MRILSLAKLGILLGLGLMLVTGSLATAQEKSEEQTEKDLAMTIELYSTIMAKTFEKADVEDAQMEKIKEVIDRCIPNLVQTRAKLEGILTAEQKKTYGAAVRQAVKAKYSQQEAEDFALRKLKLTEDELAEYKAAKDEVENINKKMNGEIEALLTDEQKARLPMFASTQPKLVTHKVRFPGMKSEEDGKKIEELVKSIKGAKVSELNVPTQAIRIDLPESTNLDVELENLIKADNKILDGWERMKVGNVFRSGTGSDAGATPGSTGRPGAGPKSDK